MSVVFKGTNGESFEYRDAKVVKKEDGKYVVYDARGSVLGAHPIDSILEFTTAEVKKSE